MKKKPAPAYTHIAVVLDRSGSMAGLAPEIIGGFNSFLADQKKVPGKATLTLVQFDNEIDRLASFSPLGEIKPLDDKTYVPRGGTKLYDAIGLTVTSVRQEIEKLKPAKRPGKVLVLVLTDGQENSSQEWDTARIKGLTEERQKAGWQFSFIGANQDAVMMGRGIGLSNAVSNLTFAATPAGASNMLRSVSEATATYRCSTVPDALFAYSAQDREAQGVDPATASAFTSNAAFSEHGGKSGALGGAARAAGMTASLRSEAASAAAKVRWSSTV